MRGAGVRAAPPARNLGAASSWRPRSRIAGGTRGEDSGSLAWRGGAARKLAAASAICNGRVSRRGSLGAMAPPPRQDPWTVASIAVVAYAAANLAHEGLGHGGACVLAGGRAEELSAVFFQCASGTVTAAGERIVAAGGSVCNVVLAAAALAAARRCRLAPVSARYFLWLFTALNLLTAFGYLLFSGLGGVGDWVAVIDGLPGQVPLRVAMAGLGGLLYFGLAPRLLWPGLEPFLGAGHPEREQRARTLTVLPYAVGGATYILAGLRNRYGLELVLLSAAAASLGGTSLLAWFFTLRARKTEGASTPPLAVARSLPWLAAGAISLAVFIGVLGSGIRW